MLREDKFTDATATISQRFMMLVQALSGIRSLTSITINSSEEEELLQQTMDALSQNLDFERCSIFLLNNSEELHCVVGKSWHQNEEINKMDLAKESHIFEIG